MESKKFFKTMSYGLYISAEGANAQSKRLETIANNLANVDTVGFKKDLAVFQARFAEGIEEGLVAPWTGSLADQGGGTTLKQTATDFSEGRLKETKRKLDMAIQGEGFFQVQKDGEIFLTRAGNFDLTGEGQLVTAQGYPVLNNEGTPIMIDPSEGEWTLTPDGMIDQAGSLRPVGLVRPESLDQLVKIGENLFRATSEVTPVEGNQRHMTSHYLEQSSVEASTEMVEMITTSRFFQANTQMMQTQDEMTSGLISRVLRAN